MSGKVPFIQYSGDMTSKLTGPHALQVEIHGTPLDHISLCAAAVADVYERYTRPGTEKAFLEMFIDQVACYINSKKSTVDVETVDYIKKILKGDKRHKPPATGKQNKQMKFISDSKENEEKCISNKKINIQGDKCMNTNAEKRKNYWSKIPVAFWERAEVIEILARKFGAEIMVMFIKMIGKAANTDGRLRVTEAIPYDVGSLTRVFQVTPEIATNGYDLLQRYGFIRIEPDKTIVIIDFNSYIGSETVEAASKRERRARAKKPTKSKKKDDGQCPDNVRTNSTDIELEIELEKELEIDKEKQQNIVYNNVVVVKENDNTQPQPLPQNRPTLEEVKEYIQANNKVVDPAAFVAYYDERGWKTDKGRSMVAFWKERVDKLDLISRDRAETSGGSSEPVPYMQKDYKEEIRDHVDDLDDLLGNDGE